MAGRQLSFLFLSIVQLRKFQQKKKLRKKKSPSIPLEADQAAGDLTIVPGRSEADALPSDPEDGPRQKSAVDNDYGPGVLGEVGVAATFNT